MAEQDNGYKRLFSHPEMVADLLRGFVREEWVRELDFSTLERVSGGFVTPGLKGREADVVWRVRWGRDRWLYVYLLIELQSTVDRFMALRLMVYVGLLYQRLIQEGQLADSGKLPPVLPLVFYNGYAPWGAARDMADLVEQVPGGLELYRPRLRYCLLDEARMVDSELASLRNLAAALFRLDKSSGPEEYVQVLTALIEWLQEPELEELARSFLSWAQTDSLRERLGGISIPEVATLKELKSMLEQRVVPWPQQWEQKGFDRGLEQGLEKGLEQGLEKGLEQGLEKGLEKARGVLLQELARRFGPLPDEARHKIEAIDSIEDLTALSIRVGAAPSLAALGLS